MTPIKNARLYPLRIGRFGHVSGGIFNAAGQAVAWPLLGSSRANMHRPSRRPSETDQSQSKAIYCGVWFSHFGHFITETLPNLCMLVQSNQIDRGDRILFHSLGDAPARPLPNYVLAALDQIGLHPDQFDWVTQPIVIDTLSLPRPAFTKRFVYDPHLKNAIDTKFKPPQSHTGKKIFLSRAALSNGAGRGQNQTEIEALFGDHGFEPLSPENHTFEEQRQILSGASALAGLNGSGLHWALYCPHMTKVISLGWKLRLQDGICSLRGQSHINLPGAGLSRFKSRNQRDLSIGYLESALSKHLP